MAGMSRKEIDRLLDHVAPQGVGLTRMKKGVLLRLPDQSTTMVHFTPSDHRAAQNLRARLKRAGVTWPTDGDPLPKSVTEHQPRAGTLAKAERLLLHWDQKHINASQLVRLAQARGETLSQGTAAACLYHLGWTPTGPFSARKWLRPLGPDEPETVPVDAPVTPIRPETETDPAAIKVETGREFIDSVDSWCADINRLPAGMPVGDVLRVLSAFGLSAELRAWKTPQTDAGGVS